MTFAKGTRVRLNDAARTHFRRMTAKAQARVGVVANEPGMQRRTGFVAVRYGTRVSLEHFRPIYLARVKERE